MELIESPLNYTGGKYKLLPQILPLFPSGIRTFVDLFCGGCNVGMNVPCQSVIFNDLNTNLISIYQEMKNNSKEDIMNCIYDIIEKYNLSLSSKYGYSFYGCDSSTGLSCYNRESFLALRSDYNKGNKALASYNISLILYTLIVYAFNNQIRFNSVGEYNLPVGKRDFNSRMQAKLSTFIDYLHSHECSFSSLDFRSFDISGLNYDDFIYIDPPYLITCATYNENDSWNEDLERDLLSFLDILNDRNIRFALSNVLRSKGKTNSILLEWLARNKARCRIIYLDYSYSNSNYHAKNRDLKSDEVLILNY